MSFLDLGSFAEPKLSMDNFREWAGSVAAAYLRSGVPPTESLCKIAQSEELTPHQIAVLAAEANKAIHQAKYASAGDKYMAADFPLADAKAAIARLQLSGETKVAVRMPTPALPDTGPDPYAMFGVKPEVMDKTASVKTAARAMEERLVLLKGKLDDAVYLAKCAMDASERAFLKEARQLVLTNAHTPEERASTLGALGQYTKTAGAHVQTRASLAKLAYAFAREGLMLPAHGAAAMQFFLAKEADVKAPECLISENLPAQVVNGTHPLYITLKTFRDHAGRLNDESGRAGIVADKLHYLRQKIRAL